MLFMDGDRLRVLSERLEKIQYTLYRLQEQTEDVSGHLDKHPKLGEIHRNLEYSIEELERETNACRTLHRMLELTLEVYGTAESRNLDYLEEVRATGREEKLYAWKIPEWIYSMLS